MRHVNIQSAVGKFLKNVLHIVFWGVRSVLAYSITLLQRVLNCAARVIFGGDCRDHVTPLLRDKLHWLRARERIRLNSAY